MIYTSLYAMIFDGGRTITWASGRGLGPGNLEFFGPKWHSPIGSMPFPGHNPLPLALVMNLNATKTLRTGPYKS
jgi:hypothetical protein